MFWQIFCVLVCHRRYNHGTWASAKLLDHAPGKSVLKIWWFQPRIHFRFFILRSILVSMWFNNIDIYYCRKRETATLLVSPVSSFQDTNLFIKNMSDKLMKQHPFPFCCCDAADKLQRSCYICLLIHRVDFWVWLFFIPKLSGLLAYFLSSTVLICPKVPRFEKKIDFFFNEFARKCNK